MRFERLMKLGSLGEVWEDGERWEVWKVWQLWEAKEGRKVARFPGAKSYLDLKHDFTKEPELNFKSKTFFLPKTCSVQNYFN